MKNIKRIIIALVIVLVGISADQAFKMWIVDHLELGQVKNIIPGFMSLTYVQNNGAAWSSFEGQMWFFMLITPVAVLVAAYILWRKLTSNFYYVGFIFIIIGALGNFVDRIRLGFVVDMFQTDFVNFPIFNIADSFLTIGFIILFIAILTDKSDEEAEMRAKEKDGKHLKK